ncbi:hypothetical protein [Photobacterium aquae]|uniref:hypothetical protein n=1 Tax=Photobacterium aquae TaxID=1195763 RepID=UPI000A06626A|nr:hypothetical protein [Photobacterium aquae]
MSLSIYGIDLAKHSFSIHGEDANGNTLIHKTISRAKEILRLRVKDFDLSAFILSTTSPSPT